MNKIQESIAFYGKLPGFCETLDGFVINARDVANMTSGDSIYEASIYAHTEDFEDYEYEEVLGLFPNEKSAQNAVASFCARNALFMNNPLLEIEQLVQKYTVNERCGWVEGFVVV